MQILRIAYSRITAALFDNFEKLQLVGLERDGLGRLYFYSDELAAPEANEVGSASTTDTVCDLLDAIGADLSVGSDTDVVTPQA